MRPQCRPRPTAASALVRCERRGGRGEPSRAGARPATAAARDGVVGDADLADRQAVSAAGGRALPCLVPPDDDPRSMAFEPGKRVRRRQWRVRGGRSRSLAARFEPLGVKLHFMGDGLRRALGILVCRRLGPLSQRAARSFFGHPLTSSSTRLCDASGSWARALRGRPTGRLAATGFVSATTGWAASVRR